MCQILSMRNDVKVKLLNEAGIQQGVEFVGASNNRNSMFFLFLLKRVFSFKKPDAVVVRYLNDHPRLLHSLLIALSVCLSLLICSVFRIKVFWILHNVDKETDENYPRLTKLLRCMVGKKASVIFLTDLLLVRVAEELYPEWRGKFDYITFGVVGAAAKRTDERLLTVLRELSESPHVGKVLFCPTSAGDKYTHIHAAPKLVRAAKELGLNYKVVLVGDLKSYFKLNPKLEKELRGSGDIIILDERISYVPEEIAPYIDFYWRSLADQSVSFTMYEAACVERPLLTLQEGFMGHAVAEYEMGAVLLSDMSNLSDCDVKLGNWRGGSAARFLDEHTWDFAVTQFKKYLVGSL